MSTAVRYILPAAATKSSKNSLSTGTGTIQLSCHVKPGASSKREGITSVTETQIELCVAAQAREGEANKAVRELISEVLGVAKSSVDVAKGHKSRDKTVVVKDVDTRGDADACLEEMRRKFEDAVDS
ncbi:MAG: hypothetical protein M1837_001242 [Sclerophora amabilis]|nr:MAG: hypothetical protein M1837_001242 [Sclerophora amabilis]